MAKSELSDETCSAYALERLAYSVQEAATVTGIGRTTLYRLIKAGQLLSKKIGQRCVIRAADLNRLFKEGEYG